MLVMIFASSDIANVFKLIIVNYCSSIVVVDVSVFVLCLSSRKNLRNCAWVMIG